MLAECDLTHIDFLDLEPSQILIEYSSSNEEFKIFLLDSTNNNQRRVSNYEKDDQKTLLLSANIKL